MKFKARYFYSVFIVVAITLPFRSCLLERRLNDAQELCNGNELNECLKSLQQVLEDAQVQDNQQIANQAFLDLIRNLEEESSRISQDIQNGRVSPDNVGEYVGNLSVIFQVIYQENNPSPIFESYILDESYIPVEFKIPEIYELVPSIYEASGDLGKVAESQQRIAEYYAEIGDFIKAAGIQEKVIDYYEKIEDFGNASEHREQLVRYYKQAGEFGDAAASQVNLINAYLDNGNYSSAVQALTPLRSLFENLSLEERLTTVLTIQNWNEPKSLDFLNAYIPILSDISQIVNEPFRGFEDCVESNCMNYFPINKVGIEALVRLGKYYWLNGDEQSAIDT